MCLHFHYKLFCQRENLPQAIRRFEGRKCKEEIREMVPPFQHAVYKLAIPTVKEPFLATLKSEISPHHDTGWNQLPENYVRALVHMMMPVDAIRSFTVNSPEFVKLLRHDVFE